jgi:large subunit ribosomal protein L4
MAVALPVLTFQGEVSGKEVDLDLKSARPETARAVVHRGLITEQQNKRRGTASTLSRGEVRGGGRKPYKQKKTGRARRGSQRTPLRPGGGVIFGPKPRDWSIKINKKEKRLAISTALQKASGSFIVVEDFEESIEPKTKVFISAVKRWGADPAKPSLLFTMNATENLVKSSRNLSTLQLMTPRSLNLFDVLKAQKLIFTRSSIDYLNERYGVDGILNLRLFERNFLAAIHGTLFGCILHNVKGTYCKLFRDFQDVYLTAMYFHCKFSGFSLDAGCIVVKT